MRALQRRRRPTGRGAVAAPDQAKDAPPALEVVRLEAFYGKSQVIFDLSLTIRSGETVTVLGRNGAGKTSTLMAVAGLISARAGAIRLDGQEISNFSAFRRVRAGLSLVPSGSRSFSTLTVHQNLLMVKGRADGAGGWAIDDVYAAFPRLALLKESRGAQLSGGERQMLAVGRAMLANPRVLMLDEPSEGLAPIIVREIGRMLRELNAAGLAVLLTEQNHRLALEAADRAYFLEKGQIAWHGSVAEADDPDVIARYLAV